MSYLHNFNQQLLSCGYTGASSVLAEVMDTVYQQADKSEPVLSSYMSGYTASNGSAYWGAVYSPKQDKLWFIPHQNSVSEVWHYMDCRTQKVVAYAHGTSGIHVTDAAYAGGSWDPGTDRIYMHPMAQTTTLHYIDCASGAVVAYKGFSGLPVRYSVGGGAYDPVNQRVWLPPAVGSTGTHWPYIDTRTATTGWYPHGTTGLASNSNSYSGAVYSPASRKVFFLPLWQVRSDLYHYIDCDTLKVCAYSSGASGALSGSTGSSFVGGVYDSYHDRVYLMPFNAKGNYLYIDCRTNKVVSYAGASGVVNCDYAHGGCYSPLTRRIYLSYRNAPAYGATGTWSYIDTEANKLVTYKGSSSIVASLASPGTFVPSLNRVYFTPYGGAAVSPWYYVQESAPRTPALLPYAMGAAPAQGLSLICLDEAEVSMLCVDGSDGKGGVFQLHTVYSDRQEHNGWCSWQSSDPSVASVSSTGMVTAVSNGGAALGKDVTITASYGGLSYSCLFTVYQTMPSADVEGEGLWTIKGGCGGRVYNSTDSTLCTFSAPIPNQSMLYASNCEAGYFTETRGSNGCTSKVAGIKGIYISSCGANRAGSCFITMGTGSALSGQMRIWGPTITSGYRVNQNAYCSDGAYNNGTLYSATDNIYYDTLSNTPILEHTVKSYINKNLTVSYSSAMTYSSRNSLANELVYSFQNYVRYTDRTVISDACRNSVAVLNMGALGSGYNLLADNVPSGWFGV